MPAHTVGVVVAPADPAYVGATTAIEKGTTMSDRVTVSGTVEAAPRVVVTAEGLAVASFRLRSRPRGGGRLSVPASTVPGCYVVTALDDLARGVSAHVRAGDRVVVGGALVLIEGEGDGGLIAELHADAIGLDLATRSRSSAVERRDSQAVLS